MNKLNPSIQNGLENIKFRAKDITCDLNIGTQLNKGTTIRSNKK